MFKSVSDLPPPGQLQRLHGRVLDVHVRVDPVPDQQLDDGVLRSDEEVVGVELKTSRV